MSTRKPPAESVTSGGRGLVVAEPQPGSIVAGTARVVALVILFVCAAVLLIVPASAGMTNGASLLGLLCLAAFLVLAGRKP